MTWLAATSGLIESERPWNALLAREQTRGRVARHTVLAQLARLARRRRPGGVNVTVIDGM